LKADTDYSEIILAHYAKVIYSNIIKSINTWQLGLSMCKKRYRRGRDPTTRRSAYQHRIVLSQHLGRELSELEVVHHLDGNTSNNAPENLLLLENQAVHMRLEHYLRRQARGLECLFDLKTWLEMYGR
jgi:hypothetical protein